MTVTLLTVQTLTDYSTAITTLLFPQIDIIGAVVIVWRVRGKIIRYVLCNIVCSNCAQCIAHTLWTDL